LQYTGLKDKNCKEVYKGDILEVEPQDRNAYPEDSLFFVSTNLTLWGYEFNWEHISGYSCSTHIVEGDRNSERLLNVAVIGNIYDNPELLEVENEVYI